MLVMMTEIVGNDLKAYINFSIQILTSLTLLLLVYVSLYTLKCLWNIKEEQLKELGYIDVISALIFLFFLNFYVMSSYSLKYILNVNGNELTDIYYLKFISYLMVICVASASVMVNGVTKFVALKTLTVYIFLNIYFYVYIYDN